MTAASGRRARSWKVAVPTRPLLAWPASVAWTLVLLWLPWQSVFAEAWLIKPTVSFTTQYEDNIRLDPVQSDAAWTYIPVVQALISRQTETLDVRAVGQLGYRVYDSSANLEDRGDQLLQLGSSYRTERSAFGLDGAWRRQDTFSERFFFDPEAPADVPVEDADVRLVQVQATRNRGNIVPSYTYQWSERTQVGAEFAYEKQYYTDAEDLGLTDYEEYSLALNHRYRLDERTTWTNTLRATDYETSDAARKYRTDEILTGIDRAFTERLRLGVDVGWRRTDFETPSNNGSNSGYTLQLTAAWRDELSLLTGRLSHKLVPSSSGDLVEQDQVVVKYRYDLTPRLGMAVKARYFENQSLLFGNARNNRRYLYLEPSMEYALSLAWRVRATVFHEREDRDTFENAAENTGVMFSVVYNPPSELD